MFLVDRCDVLTIEIEHVDVATMEILEQQGVDCQPKASTIRIIQVCFSLTLPFGYWKTFISVGAIHFARSYRIYLWWKWHIASLNYKCE